MNFFIWSWFFLLRRGEIHQTKHRWKVTASCSPVPCVLCVYHSLFFAITTREHHTRSAEKHTLAHNKCTATTEKKSHGFRFAFISFGHSSAALRGYVAYTKKTIQFRRLKQNGCVNNFEKKVVNPYKYAVRLPAVHWWRWQKRYKIVFLSRFFPSLICLWRPVTLLVWMPLNSK